MSLPREPLPVWQHNVYEIQNVGKEVNISAFVAKLGAQTPTHSRWVGVFFSFAGWCVWIVVELRARTRSLISIVSRQVSKGGTTLMATFFSEILSPEHLSVLSGGAKEPVPPQPCLLSAKIADYSFSFQH